MSTATAIALALASPAQAGERLKIEVAERGVYAVHWEDLIVAGMSWVRFDPAGLALTSAGVPVPIHINDQDRDGFGPGDWFEFVGRGPGTDDKLDTWLTTNVYVVDTGADGGARMHSSPGQEVGKIAQASRRARIHLEHDELLPRFSGNDPDQPATQWFWAKMTHIDDEPFATPIDLSDLDTASEGGVSITVALRGWSRQQGRGEKPEPDHRVELSLNGNAIGASQWNGTGMHHLVVDGLSAGSLSASELELTARVPARVPEGATDPIVDVVLVDSIEVDFPRAKKLHTPQSIVRIHADQPASVVFSSTEKTLVAYDSDGERRLGQATPTDTEGESGYLHRFPVGEGDHDWILVTDGALRRPDSLRLDTPSNLADTANKADYLIVAHHTLIDAVTPLAEFHRERGLDVDVIDVEDVYDEFSHGQPVATGLKAFFEHAWRNWQRPAPRFVLLVGDASWDTKHEDVDPLRYDDLYYRPGFTDFARVPAFPYASESGANDRNLIPAGNFETPSGHSASDNELVSFDEETLYPEMAIGRFPVVDPEDVRAIVDKTIAYASDPPEGDWSRNILWITNQERWPQKLTDRLADRAAQRGLTPTKIYPQAEEADNEEHQGRIRKAFDAGQLLVHFHGHGGRFIWRTGPPDFKKNHDLFTLDDLEALEPNERLPIVLSMSCYSAPFDHPNADSIGEKLLRMDDKGAIAVIAASWRNSPSEDFSRALVDELTQPGTVGEAVMRAKRAIRNRNLIGQYNLLGDPALQPALPPGLAPPPPVEETVRAAGRDRFLPLQDRKRTQPPTKAAP